MINIYYYFYLFIISCYYYWLEMFHAYIQYEGIKKPAYQYDKFLNIAGNYVEK